MMMMMMISLKAELYSTKCFEKFYVSMLDTYHVLVQFLIVTFFVLYFVI